MRQNTKISLVGYTGFVGSNIAESTPLYGKYNSKNIEDSYGSYPDILIYAGLRAEKYIANKYPEQDMASIYEAIHNIEKIKPRKLVLISTIDVYDSPVNVNEDSVPDEHLLLPYGKNRFFFEKWAVQNLKDCFIVRLPGLFGTNIKKNFIYDMIHKIPFKLNSAKYMELYSENHNLAHFYTLDADGFYKCSALSAQSRLELLHILETLNFSALNFTDSRGVYQFYNLKHLWTHIYNCLENNIKLVNMASEPISISELYHFVTGKDFQNEIMSAPPHYDFQTKHAADLGGSHGYLFRKEDVMSEIKKFIEVHAKDIEK